MTRIRIRMDPHWFGSPDPDLDPHRGSTTLQKIMVFRLDFFAKKDSE
jgi:hypothetical protein